MKRLRTLMIALIALIALMPAGAAAAPLEIDLSADAIEITPSFKGTELILFGAVSGISADDVRAGRVDVVLAIKGPPRPVVVRRKERVLGLWINRGAQSYASEPGYVAIASTRPLDAITAGGEGSAISVINLDSFVFDRAAGAMPRPDYARALIRLRRDGDLYSVQDRGIRFIGDSLFRATVEFPANVPIGNYRADVYLIRDGRVSEIETNPLSVDKSGIERLAFRMAHENAPLYGLICVLLAIAAGWLASVIFYRK